MVKESNIKIKMLGLGNAGLLFTIPFKVFGPTVSTWNIFNLGYFKYHHVFCILNV